MGNIEDYNLLRLVLLVIQKNENNHGQNSGLCLKFDNSVKRNEIIEVIKELLARGYVVEPQSLSINSEIKNFKVMRKED
jgi:hypothetical protein